MEMDLLSYQISIDQNDRPSVVKNFTGENEILVDSIDAEDRSKEGVKLELAYKILEDYKGSHTSEEYLEDFVERFLKEPETDSSIEISPGEIEEWLDKELDAPEEYITCQKQD